MPARTSITSANSVFTLVVAGLFPVPINIQGYATDDAFSSAAVSAAQAIMGVDGVLSAGFTPFPTKLSVVLQADSESKAVFETWLQAMQSGREVVWGDATIALPSIQQTFIFTKGVLTEITQVPAAKKVLQPVHYEITFENLSSVPLAAA